mmetsp:Transcript_5941/g.20232  ORF Transcript_5941/g.20232 Transcript_5941/m.20232 type:complete len:276 (+) Transcript_5941:826-1653(+)
MVCSALKQRMGLYPRILISGPSPRPLMLSTSFFFRTTVLWSYSKAWSLMKVKAWPVSWQMYADSIRRGMLFTASSWMAVGLSAERTRLKICTAACTSWVKERVMLVEDRFLYNLFLKFGSPASISWTFSASGRALVITEVQKGEVKEEPGAQRGKSSTWQKSVSVFTRLTIVSVRISTLSEPSSGLSLVVRIMMRLLAVSEVWLRAKALAKRTELTASRAPASGVSSIDPISSSICWWLPIMPLIILICLASGMSTSIRVYTISNADWFLLTRVP